MAYSAESLQTIDRATLAVPQTRFKDARSVQDFARRLIDNDSRRSWKRSRVNGLVDGNPPYKHSKLLEAGRADACNVNWGTARSYLESAVGSFYDLFSEAPDFLTAKTAYGDRDQKAEWSIGISEEANRILKQRKTQPGQKVVSAWDYNMQISQWEMVLHGSGPFLFEDNDQVLPKAFLCGDLKVPEFTKSDTAYFEAAMIQGTYFPPELYRFIEDGETAKRRGWNVSYTKEVIANAVDIRQQAGIQYEWEFYQQEMKNNSLAYYDDSKIIRIAHVFWREFDGRITHAIVERDTASGLETEYLFIHPGRYDNWAQLLHPMYFDHGNGGFHHSVTGLGVKMYAAMDYENRLICNLADKTFAPKVLFKPTSTEATQRMEIARLGDFGTVPAGWDAMQTPIAGLLDEGLAMHEAMKNLISSNLSSYRQQVPPQRTGNPATKFEKQLEAMQQSALNKTQFNRYYEQLDCLYAEIYRRLANPNSRDPRAKEFQDKCQKRGIPQEALSRIESVQATRVVGQGSAFMRKQAIDSLFPIAGSLPEDGRANLIADKIAAEAGQSAVGRYFPQPLKSRLPSDQEAEATQWVAAMKIGVQPKVTDSQNPVTYAATYLSAAVAALQSVKQGGDPVQVLSFLNISGPAIGAQLQRFAQDVTRQPVFQEMQKQWQQLAQATDQLKAMLARQREANGKQQKRTQTAMSDEQIKSRKAQADIAIKQAKTAAQLKQSAEKHRQSLSIKDAEAASEITLNRLKAFQS